jgi:peptide/nickel transport system substrate-binding protein
MKRRQLIQLGAAAGAGLTLAGVPMHLLAAGKKGGVINAVVQPEPPSLMMGITQNGPTQLIAGNIYEGLLRYDEKVNPLPALATSWTVNKEGTLYTFKLKPGVTWHDGKPFTAADVVFSADVFLRKTHARLRANLAAVDTIRAVDALTVEFKLKYPFGPFMGIFEVGSMPMVPKHLYEGTDFATNPANAKPIGTGPFKFKEWVKGSYIQLVANDKYHVADQPLVDTLYFHVIPDAASRAAAFESGKVDLVPGGAVEYFDVQRLAKLPGVSVTTKGWEFFAPHSWLWINHRKAPMDSIKFRQALMFAIDREAMAKIAWQGFATPATGPFNSHIKFHSNDLAFTYVYQYGDPALGVARNYTTANIAKGSPFNNVEGYSNPKVDELFDAGARESDPAKRAAIYLQVQKILLDEVPVAWLHEINFPTLYRSKLVNPISSAIGLNDSLGRASIA